MPALSRHSVRIVSSTRLHAIDVKGLDRVRAALVMILDLESLYRDGLRQRCDSCEGSVRIGRTNSPAPSNSVRRITSEGVEAFREPDRRGLRTIDRMTRRTANLRDYSKEAA